MSIANEIALAVAARMELVKTDDGYSTDIGQRVMRGRKRLDPDQLPCSVLVERDPSVKDSTKKQAKVAQRFILEGHAACDADNPNDMGHQIIADLKKAVFSAPLTYGTSGKVIDVSYVGHSIAPREDGFAVVSASVEVEVEFVETLASP